MLNQPRPGDPQKGRETDDLLGRRLREEASSASDPLPLEVRAAAIAFVDEHPPGFREVFTPEWSGTARLMAAGILLALGAGTALLLVTRAPEKQPVPTVAASEPGLQLIAGLFEVTPGALAGRWERPMIDEARALAQTGDNLVAGTLSSLPDAVTMGWIENGG